MNPSSAFPSKERKSVMKTKSKIKVGLLHAKAKPADKVFTVKPRARAKRKVDTDSFHVWAAPPYATAPKSRLATTIKIRKTAPNSTILLNCGTIAPKRKAPKMA